ncbi:MAG: AMP-binding protein [Microbacterium sp.]
MGELYPIAGGDPWAVRDALPAALDGRHPLALGFDPEPDDVAPDGTAVVIATSGSSGVPKKVVLSGDALRASAVATAERIGQGQWMLSLSAEYVAGVQVLVRSLLAGADPVLMEGRFTPATFVAATEAMHHGPRYTSLVPAQLATLSDAAHEHREVRRALASYEAILIGGQALPAPLYERSRAAGGRVVRTYGSSETAGGCVYDGVPLDGVRVSSVDGELRISGPTLASGYLGDDRLTGRVFATDEAGARWYRTGDTGEVAADGRVRVHGRIDNVIVSGGVNVSLDRVERAVRGIPGLEQAVVLGRPDDRWGEASMILVEADPAAVQRLLDEARARVAAEIGKHARPAQLSALPRMPVLPSGKPDRVALRRMIDGLPAPIRPAP